MLPFEREFDSSVDRSILSDQFGSWEDGGIRLSRNCLEGEDILLDEILSDKLF